MTKHAVILLLGAATAMTAAWTLTAQTPGTSAEAASIEWPTYGHDSDATRFSPATQITADNVDRLEPAWVYHMRPSTPDEATGAGGRAGALPGRGRGRGGSGFSASQTTPLVVDGMMYVATPYGRVAAIDPVTGNEIWTFNLPAGEPSTRGVAYWPGDAGTPAQIVFGSSRAQLFSLDAKTGVPNAAFGDQGVVDLNTDAILRGLPGSDSLSSPPLIYRNLVITGGRTQENPPLGPAGDVRAWDLKTGRLVWTFASVPAEGEPFNDSWAGDSWRNRTGVNVWGFMTADVERGIVYMPFGAPSVDQYGGDRAGDNLFSTSLVAADANTGAYLWHFQVVHHDLWDADLSSAPVLFDVTRDGETIPAVAVIGKVGLLFIFNRVTGEPLYGVEERPVAASEVPLERSSPTQPFPLKPAPLSRMTMSEDDVATVTPELEAACREYMDGMQLGGPYLPQGYDRLSVRFPGNHGGVNWGGMSFNPELGYLFINTSEMGQVAGMRDRAPDATGPVRGEGQGNRLHPDGPYESVPGGGRFSIRTGDHYQQLMCHEPPWGQLTAVDVNTGEFAWQVPLGVTDSLPPELQKTGRPGNGGTIATAGGLVFVGATDDGRFRAFDARTGEELWTTILPGAAQAVPSTYLGRDGRQYVVITATGGGFFDAPITGDALVAFALPE